MASYVNPRNQITDATRKLEMKNIAACLSWSPVGPADTAASDRCFHIMSKTTVGSVMDTSRSNLLIPTKISTYVHVTKYPI